MTFIILKNVPALKRIEISQETERKERFSLKEGHYSQGGKGKKRIFPFKFPDLLSISFLNSILQKVLSKIKVTALKMESLSSRLLQGMREKKARQAENEEYWNQIKQSSFGPRKRKKNKKQSS